MLGGFLSDYIAENLVRIKDNAEAAKKEMENLEVHQRLMADLTDVGSVSRMQSKGVDKVLKEYEITEKLVVAKRKLSKESQEQLAYLDRQLIALEEQENVYTNIVDKMSQKTKPETGETYEDNEQQDSKVYQQDYSDLRDQVLKEIAENNKLIQQIGQMSDDHSISKGGRRTLSKVSKNTQAEIKNLKTLLKQLEENEKKQGSLTRGEQKAKQAIEETLRAREREAKVLKAVIDNKAQLGKVDKNEITNALQGQNEKLIENAELYDKIIQELQKYKHISKETMESIRNDIENQKNSLESYRESLATQSDRIDAQAAALKGFFNAASSVSAIAGSLKTLFNPDTDLSI